MAYLLHHLVSEAAHQHGSRVAVRCRGEELTYDRLDVAANGVAAALIDAGVRPGDRVGIHLPKSVEMVAAVYGAMKAGAVYVPLDPKAPAPRLATIGRDCSISALVSTPARASTLLSALEGHTPRLTLLVDDGSPVPPTGPGVLRYAEATADSHASDPGIHIVDADLAYILYTSGSTGTPKGVMLSHRHALNFVRWCASAIGVGPDDRLSNHAPLHFDLSVFDLYLAAIGGAAVVPVPDELAYFGTELVRFVEEQGITVWYSVPSALMLMARTLPRDGLASSLRAVVFAGEVYPTPELRHLRSLLPKAELWNLYGPTETNVCTYHRVRDLPDDHVPIPIGRACGNTEVFALREDGRPADVGDEGELYVRGAAVMAGYWGRPDQSAEVLVADPLRPGRREPVYRTGDLVRLRPDGEYDFLGRRDHQIKSRGYRIELGDVEAALGADPSLLESATVGVPHPDWGTAIVAWVVPRDGVDVTEARVKRFVAEVLPRYMVPSRVEVVDVLPRTSTGKVDRQRLLDASTGAVVG
jgi:amino acid adenylation domain-containing protein